MKINSFIWNNYKESQSGKYFIRNFNKFPDEFLEPFLKNYYLGLDEIHEIARLWFEQSDLSQYNIENLEQAQKLFIHLCTNGITFDYSENQEGTDIEHEEPDFSWFLDQIVPISLCFYSINKDFFKPYFFVHHFKKLITIFDEFGIELPKIPKKSDKQACFEFYWQFCYVLYNFQKINNFSPDEVCAFLYDFCPKYLDLFQTKDIILPSPSKAWFVGGNKIDFEFLDNNLDSKSHFWQGNIDTKIGDIIVVYCLSPRSYIHSIWRATSDGIADPFFYYYSHIHIGYGQKIHPILLDDLKKDDYFSKNSLVRKNFQGVNGYGLSSNDYEHLLQLIAKNSGDINQLPQLFNPNYELNIKVKNEKDVEEMMVEPLLKDLGFNNEWVRQLTVKMGRGEKVFPDYAFLTKTDKGFEQASILLECKYDIKNNNEFEQAFRQVWSYGLRLSAKLLIIIDKNCLWFFEKGEQGFDRNRHQMVYWKNLTNADYFNQIQTLITKYSKIRSNNPK